MKKQKDAILILGLFDTSIMTARCLAESGRDIYGMDYDPGMTGFASNLMKCVLIPSPRVNEKDCLDFILTWIDQLGRNLMLIPTSDEFVKFCSDYEAELSRRCSFLIPSKESVHRIIERDMQFEDARSAGIPVPAFLTGPVSMEEIRRAGISFPLAVKPVNIVEWKRVFNHKGFVIHTPEELEATIGLLNPTGVRYIAQQIIEGDNTNNFEVNTLYLPGGRYYQHSIRKIRQYPNRFGTATCIEYFSHPEMEAQALAYIGKYELYGFTNIEFKYSGLDQSYYFIETNPRVWLQVNFSMKLGINFPELYCRYLSGESTADAPRITRAGKWVDFLPDLLFWKKHHKEYGYSLWSFMKSWRPVISTSLFSLSDPRPFIKDLQPLKRFKTLLKR